MELEVATRDSLIKPPLSCPLGAKSNFIEIEMIIHYKHNIIKLSKH